jgi:hypothetical protein
MKQCCSKTSLTLHYFQLLCEIRQSYSLCSQHQNTASETTVSTAARPSHIRWQPRCCTGCCAMATNYIAWA